MEDEVMRVKVACCLALLAGLMVAPAMANVIVSTNPLVKTVDINDGPFTIDIVANMTQPIVGWGLDLVSEVPGIATRTATAPVIGPSWDPAFAPDGDGLAGLNFPNGVSGNNVVLATVEFVPVGVGITMLHGAITPGDLTEGFALYPTGFDTVDFWCGYIVVTPEPASLALLSVLAFLRRR